MMSFKSFEDMIPFEAMCVPSDELTSSDLSLESHVSTTEPLFGGYGASTNIQASEGFVTLNFSPNVDQSMSSTLPFFEPLSWWSTVAQEYRPEDDKEYMNALEAEVEDRDKTNKSLFTTIDCRIWTLNQLRASLHFPLKKNVAFETPERFLVLLKSYNRLPVRPTTRRFAAATEMVELMSLMSVGRELLIATIYQREDNGNLAEYVRGRGMILVDALLKHSVGVLASVLIHELGHAYHCTMLKSSWQHYERAADAERRRAAREHRSYRCPGHNEAWSWCCEEVQYRLGIDFIPIFETF
ncbi:unnamed protein product [Bursaphelenchus okinawaensis]|uniref:Uncharacterized protein n=1 Tax=Bursaphelenchus okinawaensis TaxID=465554 RepID=A0A811KQ42_9BILA|nr:unnamed protein product [Bursaphelenchus okinawaensis]CAG9107748.1 unnamed protein product [Bursaphelenchus okinawaensis]